MHRRRGEEGYALVAAVAAIAVFATVSLGVMAATRSALVGGIADSDAARAAAAADAGLILAVDGLLATAPEDRWAIDGRVRTLGFDGAGLAIRIEDERGKIPINLAEESQLTALLELAGLSGDKLRIARDSLEDWIDDDDEPRPDGAEADYYRATGIRPRNGALLSLGELRRVRGFDAALIERIRPLVTVTFGTGGFDARFAQPGAIGIMQGGGEGSPAAIARRRELEGQQTAFAPTSDIALIGRPLTIIVDASLPGGAHCRRTAIISLTGDRTQPYIIRQTG
jgi:general secretion pathway protein K